MSDNCNNTPAPKCCPPPVKGPPPPPPTCTLPATATFTCPADECVKEEKKPFCPPPGPPPCVPLGKATAEVSSDKPAAPTNTGACAAPTNTGACGGEKGTCESRPLSMDGSDKVNKKC